jgi:LacI family transcriptional regulator
MTTLRDVAEEAGVSIMTVSNVINGRRSKVSPATIDRIQEIAARLGYVPNASARSLSAKSSGILALVYSEGVSGTQALSNPHDSVFVGEVERQVSASGRYLMIHAAIDVTSTAANLRTWNVDGAIFLGTFGREVDALREQYDIPMVFVDNYSESSLVSVVRVDDHGGGRLAAEELTSQGHTRIAFVGPHLGDEGVVRRRYEGFVEGLQHAGVASDPELVFECPTTFESGRALAGTLLALPDPPTAVFATADIIGIGLLKGVGDAGRQVPQDLSIIGFDDLAECEHVTPALTTVHQDVPLKARSSVELLLQLITEGPSAAAGHVTLDVALASRETVTQAGRRD